MTLLHLSQYVIYDHPRDYPDGFVVREWRIGAGTVEAGQAWTAPTLLAARYLIPPGLYRFERSPGDDSVILETWI